jgi:hypothetical protein
METMTDEEISIKKIVQAIAASSTIKNIKDDHNLMVRILDDFQERLEVLEADFARREFARKEREK